VAIRPVQLSTDRLSRLAFALGVMTLTLTGEQVATQAGWWLFLISLLVFGMPHGGLDLLLARRLAERSAGRWLAVSGVYLAILAATALTLWAAPIWTLIGFGGLTVVHFGLADHRDAIEHDAGRPRTGTKSSSLPPGGVGRGLMMLGPPLAFDPGGVATTFGSAQAMLGVAAPVPATATVSSVGWAAISAGVALTIAAIFTAPAPRSRRRLAGRHLLEIALLAFAAWLLPAITYVALYFVCWHSLRHFDRVRQLASGGDHPTPLDSPRGHWLRMAGRLHLWSLPLSLPVIAALLLIGWAGLRLQSPSQWATLVLLSFVVLTPAHHLLIECTYTHDPKS